MQGVADSRQNRDLAAIAEAQVSSRAAYSALSALTREQPPVRSARGSRPSLPGHADSLASGSSASSSPNHPAARRGWSQSCEESFRVLGDAWAAEGMGSWDAGTALGRLGGSMPQWLNGGGMRSLWLEAPERAQTGTGEVGVLDGAVELRGTLEEQQLPALQAALSEALVQVLAPIAGLSMPWSGADVSCGDHGAASCCVGVSEGSRPSTAIAAFFFKVTLRDPNDLPAALELLKLESRLGGAKRLLSQLTGSLGEVAGRLSLRLDLIPPQDHPIVVGGR